MHGIYSGIALRQLAHHRQALVDLLFAEVANIEMHHIAVAAS